MGKKVAPSTSKSAKVANAPAAPEAAPESLTVALKKANDLKIKKHIKAVTAQVNEKIDMKQVVLAAKALKAFAKKQSDDKASSALLTDEDQCVHVTFTMTSVPTNPSPKPQMISIENPFLTEDQRSRVCLIVKDPARAFKD